MLLDRLRGEYNDLQTEIREIDADFASRDADSPPTEAEQDNYRALNDAMEALVPRIETESARAQRMVKGAELLNAVPSGAGLAATLDATRARGMAAEATTFGEWVRARANGDVAPDAVEDYLRATVALETAPRGDHSRAFVDQITSNLGGILPPAWLTDIMEFVGTARPFVEAFSAIPLPDTGMTVTYPTVTTRPQVGKQATQKTDVASRATTITATPASVETYGGGEDVAIQVLQRTDPAYLGIVLELYAEEMAAATDAAAITAALAAITGGNELALSAAAPKNIGAQLVAGAKLIYANRGVPNAFVMGLDVWAFIAGAADADGRPLFPDSSPANPVGSSDITSTSGVARGLNWVVDPNMPPTKAVMGWDRAFTSMLGGVQTLAADVPSKLGRDFAVYEFASFAVRRPAALVEYTLGA